jgi:CDGSH-type Zn-finger protein
MALKIIVRENGPFAVDLSTGDLLLVDHLGNEIPLPQPKPGKTTITLCRCGASSNKPFCDSTHSKIGFKGANEAARQFDQQQAQVPQPQKPQNPTPEPPKQG